MPNVQESRRVAEPMMGTGGMLRAVGEVMREQGRDPRTVQWVGCDIDELAVACATVNRMIWNLGADIAFHAGNTLTPGWEARAGATRGAAPSWCGPQAGPKDDRVPEVVVTRTPPRSP